MFSNADWVTIKEALINLGKTYAQNYIDAANHWEDTYHNNFHTEQHETAHLWEIMAGMNDIRNIAEKIEDLCEENIKGHATKN